METAGQIQAALAQVDQIQYLALLPQLVAVEPDTIVPQLLVQVVVLVVVQGMV